MVEVKAGPRWGTNYKVNYSYTTNGQPIIYSSEFKWVIYVSIEVPDYYDDLC